MLWFLLLSWAVLDGRAETIKIRAPRAFVVLAMPKDDAKVVAHVKAGDLVLVGITVGEYSKVKVGKPAIVGFAKRVDLSSAPRFIPEYGVLLGPTFSMLNQDGKQFQTQDELQYVTSKYGSSSLFPMVGLQWGEENFWRAWLLARLTRFRGQALKQLSGATVQDVEISHKLYTLAIQRVWTFKPFYIGLGFEAGKATDMTVRLSGVNLPVAAEDLPVFIGGHGVAGAQLRVLDRWSLWGEGRGVSFFNQKPAMLGFECSAGATYWF